MVSTVFPLFALQMRCQFLRAPVDIRDVRRRFFLTGQAVAHMMGVDRFDGVHIGIANIADDQVVGGGHSAAFGRVRGSGFRIFESISDSALISRVMRRIKCGSSGLRSIRRSSMYSARLISI